MILNECDKIKQYVNIFGYEFVLDEYLYPYVSFNFSDNVFRDFRKRVGCNTHLASDLINHGGNFGIVYMKSSGYSHFVGQKHLELQYFSYNNYYNRRKKKKRLTKQKNHS